MELQVLGNQSKAVSFFVLQFYYDLNSHKTLRFPLILIKMTTVTFI